MKKELAKEIAQKMTPSVEQISTIITTGFISYEVAKEHADKGVEFIIKETFNILHNRHDLYHTLDDLMKESIEKGIRHVYKDYYSRIFGK